jgi:hypothetical protein
MFLDITQHPPLLPQASTPNIGYHDVTAMQQVTAAGATEGMVCHHADWNGVVLTRLCCNKKKKRGYRVCSS